MLLQLGHGDFSSANTKVLRMVNTLAVDNEAKQTIEALQKELQKTKEKLQAVEELKKQSGTWSLKALISNFPVLIIWLCSLLYSFITLCFVFFLNKWGSPLYKMTKIFFFASVYGEPWLFSRTFSWSEGVRKIRWDNILCCCMPVFGLGFHLQHFFWDCTFFVP